MLWSSRKLTHRYMEGVAEQLSTLKNRLKTTENHNMLWYGTNSAHRYMEEKLENWKFAQFCPKTTICSGWTEFALIDIWKRWLKQEERDELMKSRVVIGTKCRSSRLENKAMIIENRRAYQPHVIDIELFGNQDRVRLRSLHLRAGATRFLTCPSVQFLGILAS